MFKNMAGIYLGDCSIAIGRQVSAIAKGIDMRSRLDIKNCPAFLCRLATDMQAQWNVTHDGNLPKARAEAKGLAGRRAILLYLLSQIPYPVGEDDVAST